MIKLFDIPNHIIDTSALGNLLHGEIVQEFEAAFASYVGAKYSCTANSASSLIFLALKRYQNQIVKIPSTIPIVVPNAIVNSDHKIEFYDDIEWVGSCYHLHEDIYDSAQQVSRNQYANLKDDDALMIFSFYPTKPVSGCDGGIIVSNNKEKIEHFQTMTMNGTSFDNNSWKRKQRCAGYKMHWTSIQAYVANENLKNLDRKNNKLDQIKCAYNDALSYNNTSRHLYRIRVSSNVDFVKKMNDQGIQCGTHYEHCHGKAAYKTSQTMLQTLPKSEVESTQTVSLPFHEQLSQEDIDKVISYVKKFR